VLGLTEKPHFPGDRYALIDGVILAAAAVSWAWSRRLGGRRLFAVLGVVLAVMIARVENYLPVWRDDVSFFRTQARQLPMPNRNPPMERLAMALASRGEHAEAELWYQLRTRDVAPEELPFELAFMRGLNREKLGDSAGAVRFYRAALARSPGRYFVMYPLGRVLFRLGENEEAANWFEAARLLARGEAEIDLEYGRALREAGFRERAVKVLEEGLSRAGLREDIREALTEELAKAQGRDAR
jgi:tetratricopeptide (TPR) repeat protein